MSQRSFTLVELLVVIAIIRILIGLSVPHGPGKFTVCAGQMSPSDAWRVCRANVDCARHHRDHRQCSNSTSAAAPRFIRLQARSNFWFAGWHHVSPSCQRSSAATKQTQSRLFWLCGESFSTRFKLDGAPSRFLFDCGAFGCFVRTIAASHSGHNFSRS